MSLEACPDCGREVSSSAESCPSCGAPLCSDKQKGNPPLLGLVAGAGVGLVIGLTTFSGRGKLGTGMVIAIPALLAIVGFLVGRAMTKK